jgi:ADP-ribose pyrophosphatase YjhB (NUDIX family)
MNYCSNCGSATIGLSIPTGDNRPRYVCDACNEIFYHNPKMVVGCIPRWDDQVLLCKRAIQPRYGLWTLPAGYMENQETAAAGAQREAHEEALAKTEILSLYTHFSIPHIDQVYILFLARLTSLDFGVGEESLDVRLFTESEIPWDELAFPVMRRTLELYFEDLKAGRFRCHSGDIVYNPSDRFRPDFHLHSSM